MRKEIFVTTEFKHKISKYWPEEVLKFLEDVESSPEEYVNSIHRYNASKIFFRKFNTGSFPRLMFLEVVNGDNILYIPRLYFNKHEDYDKFLSLDRRVQESKGEVRSELDEINSKFAEFEEPVIKEKLPIEMQDVEGGRDFSNQAQSYVFEMEEWAKNIQSPQYFYDSKVYEAIQQIIIDKVYGEPDSNGWYTCKVVDSFIIFRIQNHVQENSKGDNISYTYFYLFDITQNLNLDALNNKYTDLSDRRLLKQARKGYPDWLLYGDKKDWERLENDDEANLALSDEEVDVLNSIPYPYFINGLAGSGKSTILYYLFAKAFSYRKVRQNKMDLLFVSYSNKLVEKGKNIVTALLKSNSAFQQQEFNKADEDVLNNSFYPFLELLKQKFLFTEEEINRFDTLKHINFEKFQRMYHSCKLPEAKSYSATIVWSVIRSFIKGRDYTKFYDVNDYNQLRRDDRTVQLKDYEAIYKIFDNWYRPCSHDSWDDLDLVRYVLTKQETMSDYERYDVIYCDEAQDFTPIENKLIINLSKYSKYDLCDYKKIPIAYAGDPNQTVSPTGFNWNRLKEIFSKSFSDQIGGYISITDKTLNNNYRSKKNVVRFANSIQYIRKCFLTDDTLKPQEQWNPQANPCPGFFFVDSEKDRKLVLTGFDKATCIITGADGVYEKKTDGSDEFSDESTPITDDLLLSQKKEKIYTALSSKGLEFPAVILYRFADNMPRCFSKIFSNEPILAEADKYECSHFITKLYIAVTRAKNVLYIIDSKENYEKFWKYFFDGQSFIENTLFPSRQDSNDWRSKVCGIEMGDEALFMKRLTDNFRPLELAKEIYRNALLSRNSQDMSRAAGYFEEGGDNRLAQECRAYVLEFNMQYQAAGDKFLDLQMKDEATKAYWNGRCWDRLVEFSTKIEYELAAKYMLGSLTLQDLIKIDRFSSYFDKRVDTWSFVEAKISNDVENIPDEFLFSACEFLEELSDRGFIAINDKIASLYFKRKKYQKAIDKWDILHKTDHRDYFTAKEYMARDEGDHSQIIYWMDKLGKSDEIFKRYGAVQAAVDCKLTPEAINIVFGVLLSKKFLSALAYTPYDRDNKLTRLYYSDKARFFQHYVLKDLTEEKFNTWIEDKVLHDDTELFDKVLPVEIFTSMFMCNAKGATDRKPLWFRFFSLRDINGYRVMKNSVVINQVADALAGLVESRNSIYLASCFIDMVFDNYNYDHAKKYKSVIPKFFGENNFHRADFSYNSQYNSYFSACDISPEKLDAIMSHIRHYVETTMKEFKKLTANHLPQIMPLCVMYEKVMKYANDQQDARKVAGPDFDSVNKFYNKLIANEKMAAGHKFFNLRLIAFNELYAKSGDIDVYALQQNLKEKELDFDSFINVLGKEDAKIFVRRALGKKSVVDVDIECLNGIAKLIYTYLLSPSEIEGNKNLIKQNIENLIDGAVLDNLAGQKIDVYALKLYGFVWERMLDTQQVAGKYDKLIVNKRLSKLPILVSYLKLRALHYFAWYPKPTTLTSKMQEYGISRNVDDLKKWTKPNIEPERNDEAKPNSVEFIKDDKTIGDIEVALKSSKKTVWFSRKNIDLATIAKGQVSIDNQKFVTVINDSSFRIDADFNVSVISSGEILIVVKDKTYKILM